MANITFGGPVRSKDGFAYMGTGSQSTSEFVRQKAVVTTLTTAQVLALRATAVEICPTLTQISVSFSTYGLCRLPCGLRIQVPAQ